MVTPWYHRNLQREDISTCIFACEGATRTRSSAYARTVTRVPSSKVYPMSPSVELTCWSQGFSHRRNLAGERTSPWRTPQSILRGSVGPKAVRTLAVPVPSRELRKSPDFLVRPAAL